MSKSHKRTLLAVGPLPEPYTGTTVSFELFCREVGRQAPNLQLKVVDSSPKHIKRKAAILSLFNFVQACRIYFQFCRQIFAADLVIIFGSNGFLLSMTPLLLSIAKLTGKPCFVRAFGGSLDNFYQQQPPPLRWLLRTTLRHADGVIVQTELLYRFFTKLVGNHVRMVAGYRPLSDSARAAAKPTAPGSALRLAFVGLVRAEKGIFDLLEALRQLSPASQARVRCDIFGQIHPTAQPQFTAALSATEVATYGGVLNPSEVIPRLAQYDALVFPTYYQGEGHPGVIIEAMMAGIPVITTTFRSIPEIVTHSVNGLLVPPQTPVQLANAIQVLQQDRTLLRTMAANNYQQRHHYDAQQAVRQILAILEAR